MQGQFREDLFYRLNVIHLLVPPLRARPADIPEMVNHFFKHFTRNNGCVVRSLAPETMAALVEYPWPGNVRELENALERLVVSCRREVATPDDLPTEIRTQRNVSVRPKRERRRTVADDLYKRLRHEQASFWSTVYPLYMQREITKNNVRELVRKGLEEARGNYRIVAQLFNLDPQDYKRFLNFLRKHDCQLPFKEYGSKRPVDCDYGVVGRLKTRTCVLPCVLARTVRRPSGRRPLHSPRAAAGHRPPFPPASSRRPAM